MIAFLLTLHIVVAVALVGVVLLQRSEGGALGMGGGGMSGFLGGRATANLLTRTTAILAAVFILTSLALARFGGTRPAESVLDASPPAAEAPAPTPSPPPAPSAPLAR